jgi:hypothetical protein
MDERVGDRKVALVAGVGAIGVLVAAGMVARGWVIEEWYLYKLDTGHEDDIKTAAKRLGDLDCERAAPYLVRHLSKWTEEGKGTLIPRYVEVEINGEKTFFKEYDTVTGTWILNHDVKDALVQIGAAAVPALLDALKRERDSYPVFLWALGEMGPVARSTVPELEHLAREHASDAGFVSYLREALTKIQSN